MRPRRRTALLPSRSCFAEMGLSCPPPEAAILHSVQTPRSVVKQLLDMSSVVLKRNFYWCLHL